VTCAPLRRIDLPLFWLSLAVLVDLVIVVQISVVGSVVVLLLLAAICRLAWWHPLVPAAAVLVGIPVSLPLGAGAGVNRYAVVAIALVTLSLLRLVEDERRSLRSRDG
jgi:hypothetical protein